MYMQWVILSQEDLLNVKEEKVEQTLPSIYSLIKCFVYQKTCARPEKVLVVVGILPELDVSSAFVLANILVRPNTYLSQYLTFSVSSVNIHRYDSLNLTPLS